MKPLCENKVAVVVPCFNAQQTLSRTLDSVIAQTFPDWCLMAVNDGSSDGTSSILENYAKRYPDKINFLTHENQGQTVAKNVAIANTTSEYIALLDSDDIWADGKLERQLSLLDNNPQVAMCYTAAQKIDDKGNIFDSISVRSEHRGKCYREFLIRNKVIASSVVIRRSALEEVGSFDISFDACENWDLWIRLAKHFEIEFIDEPLTFYRVHSVNMSRNFNKIFRCRMQIIDKHLPVDSNDADLILLRKDALFKAHAAFAEAYIDILDLAAARRELLKAISINPFVKKNYTLLMKCMMGKHLFVLTRNIKKKLTGTL